MSTIRVVTPPQQTNLTTLARLKSQLNVTVSTNDTYYLAMIPVISQVIAEDLGWELSRQEWLETFVGSGFYTQVLRHTPVASLTAITSDGAAVVIADEEIFIERHGSGVVVHPGGWSRANTALWTAQYFAGWLVPDDDVTSVSMSFAVTAETITRASGAWPLLASGDLIEVSGSASNDGKYVVSARTSDTILTLDAGSGLATEGPVSASVAVRNLPDAIERAAILKIRDALANAATASGSFMTSERAGPIEQSFENLATSSSTSATSEIDTLLGPYRRKLI